MKETNYLLEMNFFFSFVFLLNVKFLLFFPFFCVGKSIFPQNPEFKNKILGNFPIKFVWQLKLWSGNILFLVGVCCFLTLFRSSRRASYWFSIFIISWFFFFFFQNFTRLDFQNFRIFFISCVLRFSDFFF
jgi:hypothetical protein